jgi:uncharacterized protein (TIGR02265 family)
MPIDSSDFVEPSWNGPLAVERVIAAIPDEAMIAGMFYLALVDGSKRRELPLNFSESRYLPFKFYPLRDFTRTLVQATQLFYPNLPLRRGLRALGASGPRAFAASTLGKVTLGAAVDVEAALRAIAKTYEINLPPGRCTVVEAEPNRLVLSLVDIYHFLDSHHVGVFEGTLEHMGVAGSVRVKRQSDTAAFLLIDWSA